MDSSISTIDLVSAQPCGSPLLAPILTCQTGQRAADLARLLDERFGASFVVFDGQTGEPLTPVPGALGIDWSACGELCREVARRGTCEILADEAPILLLAVPEGELNDRLVGVGAFLSRAIEPRDAQSRVRGSIVTLDTHSTRWLSRRPMATATMLLSLGELCVSAAINARQITQLEKTSEELTFEIAVMLEEISLLFQLTHHLSLDSNDNTIGRMALDRLTDVVPAAGLAIHLLPGAVSSSHNPKDGQTASLLACGDFPLNQVELERLLDHLRLNEERRAVVANRLVTSRPEWPAPSIRELIIVPLAERDHLFGWIIAVNHREQGEFGSRETQLLRAVATILGIHAGNTELYRLQAELLAGVVRALTSAIDAKDPYTCGHSDRVARVAVHLAQEVGLPDSELRTVYLAGLLHDIGKIGVDDAVLRKPGKLTPEEFEHIKQHAQIGYNILVDLKQLEPVLPGVRHHHESWDGRGYPVGLAGQDIPLLARILAVADSFDAMGSDRPYRPGMPQEKVEAILRDGAGRQWDPVVVDAFFRVRDVVNRIADRHTVSLEQIPPDDLLSMGSY